MNCLDCGAELRGHGNPKRCRKCAWKASYDRRVRSMQAVVNDNLGVQANRVRAAVTRWSNPNARRMGKISPQEHALAALLLEAGVDYTHQYNPTGCRWVYDFLLPSYGMLLELDGPSHKYESKVKTRDCEKDDWALLHGYSIGRIWEADLPSMTPEELVSWLK